jgi:predicted ribosomally synthesized peptide with nif11-like leader
MTEKQLEILLFKAVENAELREKLKLVTDPNSFAALIHEAGIEAAPNKTAPEIAHLTDRELESVAGGFTSWACFRLATTLLTWV